MVVLASSSMPVTTMVEDVRTTDGMVILGDITTEGVVTKKVGTTKDGPTVVAESEKPYQYTCKGWFGIMRPMFFSPKSMTFYRFCVHWVQLHLFLFGWSKWIMIDSANYE